MPLKSGSSSEVRSENIRELRHSGYPEKQAVAIAYKKSGEDASLQRAWNKAANEFRNGVRDDEEEEKNKDCEMDDCEDGDCPDTEDEHYSETGSHGNWSSTVSRINSKTESSYTPHHSTHVWGNQVPHHDEVVKASLHKRNATCRDSILAMGTNNRNFWKRP